MSRATLSRPLTLVTGASSGIGEAMAILLAQGGEDVVLVARSIEKLRVVARKIQDETGKDPLVAPIDLEDRDAAKTIQAILADSGGAVRHLVNSAGYGLIGDVKDLPAGGQLGMIDVNCRALVELTSVFLPDIVAQKGGVLNVSSVAGFVPGPGFAVYYASKAFVLSFTRALRAEMKGRGVTISTLCPGPTTTGFGPRSGVLKPWAGTLMRSMDAATVAKIGIEGYRAGKAVIVPGFRNKTMVALFGLLPTRWVLPLVGAAQRQRRR